MKVSIEAFTTVDGTQTISIVPATSRRQKANWSLWIKEDGHGLLSIDTTMQRIELPSNSKRTEGDE